MKKTIFVMIMLFLISTQVRALECGFVSDNFNLDLPSIDLLGTNYRVQLDCYDLDDTYLYYRLNNLTQGFGTACASLDSNLNISVYCVEYLGTKLTFPLILHQNPYYWKLNLVDVTVAKDGTNQKPVAQSISLNVASTLPYIQQQLSANDPNGDILTYELISDARGTGYSAAYVNPNTGLLYLTHEPAGNNSFSISYRVTDSRLFSDPATVNIQVNYLSDEEKETGKNDVPPDAYAAFRLSTYNSDLLGQVGETPSQPQSIDLSANFPNPGDQGRQNSCVGWATAYALKSYQEKVEIGWSLNSHNHLFSPAFLYNQINHGQDQGSYINEALNLAVNKGLATLAAMPYFDTNYINQPTQAALDEASRYKAAGWFRINDTSQIKAALVNRKPVVCGIKVYPQLMELKGADSVYNTATGENQGGHAVTIVGYDNNRFGGAFKVINSWSQNWGDNGFFWMPYSFVARGILSEAYVLEDAENSADPIPEDPTEPVPDYSTLPNLTIESWNASCDPKPRGAGTLIYSIVNTGTGIAPAGADVNFMLSTNEEITTNDHYIIYETIPFDLQPGAAAVRDEQNSIGFRLPDQLESGYYYMGLWVDDLDLVTESNENDNISMGNHALNITNSLPDLSVNTWYAEWSRYDGYGTLTYEVINSGATATTTTDWDINLILDSDQVIGNGNEIILFYEKPNDILNPGQSTNSVANFNLYQDTFGFQVPSGVYFMALWVDDLNKENESNEMNNGSYSWGTVPIYGYRTKANNQALPSAASDETLQGKAYNGKKLPPKDLVLQKIEISRDSSGNMRLKTLGREKAPVLKGKQPILPSKKLSSKFSLIFPTTIKHPMPKEEVTHE